MNPGNSTARARVWFPAAVLLGLLAAAAIPAEAPSALDLYRAGKFDEAAAQCQATLRKHPKDSGALVVLGSIFLLRNKPDDAITVFNRALDAGAGEKIVDALLMEAYRRKDDYAEAAPLARQAGLEGMARTMEMFTDAPYKLAASSDETTLPFVPSVSLPIVTGRVGGADVRFLVDTGASLCWVAPEIAKAAGATADGQSESVFAGGKTAAETLGRLPALTLGGFTFENLPVTLGEVPESKDMFQGIIGTDLLSHLLPTLDYPGQKLVLRRKTAALPAGGGDELPLWLGGDHFLVTRGTVDQSPPLLFVVDTGISGAGFLPSATTLADAKIDLSKARQIQGEGGAGAVKVKEFTVDRLTLGPVEARNVPAIFGAFPPPLEYQLGFRIAAIVSHAALQPYALTIDFTGMRLILRAGASGS